MKDSDECTVTELEERVEMLTEAYDHLIEAKQAIEAVGLRSDAHWSAYNGSELWPEDYLVRPSETLLGSIEEALQEATEELDIRMALAHARGEISSAVLDSDEEEEVDA